MLKNVNNYFVVFKTKIVNCVINTQVPSSKYSNKLTMKKIFFLSLFAFFAINAKSQCTTCTINITGIDTVSYTVLTGQTLCIDTTGLITGTVILNGGTICNKGVFKPSSFTYTSGSINNQGNMTINSDITMTTGSSLDNSITGIIALMGNITLSGTTINNIGILNISQNIQFNSGTFINDNIINVNLINGSGTINNTGTINTNN